jgi:nucleoside permease NupC
VINEFLAYRYLVEYTRTNAISARSTAIATYALCGFSNPAAIGISQATLCALCPERAPVFSRVVLRSFIAGSVACFMTACIAGSLIDV